MTESGAVTAAMTSATPDGNGARESRRGRGCPPPPPPGETKAGATEVTESTEETHGIGGASRHVVPESPQAGMSKVKAGAGRACGLCVGQSIADKPAAADPSPSDPILDWLLRGLNEYACLCAVCRAAGPWAENHEARRAAARAAGWREELDEELDEDGNLTCRTARWVCGACNGHVHDLATEVTESTEEATE